MIKTLIRFSGKISWPTLPNPVSIKKPLLTPPTSVIKKFEFIPVISSINRPKLCNPKHPPRAFFQPSRYFSKGNEPKLIFDRNLLSESFEAAKPKIIPFNSKLIRSICKGTGILKKDETGLIHLDIDNRFINNFLPHFASQGIVRPPYFNVFSTLHGAHIPIISKRESDFNYLSYVRELGKEYCFEVEGLYALTPDSWPEMEEVWFLKVHSEKLEEFRKSYLLTPLPLGHSFHIVIGVKPRVDGSKAVRPQPFLRINPGVLPV